MNTGNAVVNDAADELIAAVSAEFSADEAETLRVLLESFDIYLERGKKYGQLWRSYGWKGNVFHILSKAARIRRMFWDTDQHEGSLPHDMNDTMDDIKDIINYAVFVIRDMRDGNKYGS